MPTNTLLLLGQVSSHERSHGLISSQLYFISNSTKLVHLRGYLTANC